MNLAEAARGVLFPTLWLNIKSLGGNRFSQGIAVAAFSMGRVVTSPVLGFCSDLFGCKRVLIFSNLTLLVGCLVYAASKSVMGIVLAQFLIGCGAGRWVDQTRFSYYGNIVIDLHTMQFIA